MMYAEIAWVLVSSRTQVQPQVIFDPDYLLDHLSVSCESDRINRQIPENCDVKALSYV